MSVTIEEEGHDDIAPVSPLGRAQRQQLSSRQQAEDRHARSPYDVKLFKGARDQEQRETVNIFQQLSSGKQAPLSSTYIVGAHDR